MRLIDADELKDEVFNRYCDYASNGRDLDKASEYNLMMNLVEIQPTVEAMPMNYLRHRIQEELERDHPYTAQLIARLLNDWRKYEDQTWKLGNEFTSDTRSEEE